MIGAASGAQPTALSQHTAARDAPARRSAVLQITDNTRQAKRDGRCGPSLGSEMSRLVLDPRKGPLRKSRATRMERAKCCTYRACAGAPDRFTLVLQLLVAASPWLSRR